MCKGSEMIRIEGYLVVILGLALTACNSNALQDDSSTSAKWPFAEWETAKAYAFNFRPMERNVALHIYKQPEGWNPNIVEIREVVPDVGQRVIRWVNNTRGANLVSKCPFPRHGIVLFDEDGAAVGSVSVCFECGDILVWPSYFRTEDEYLKALNDINPDTEISRLFDAHEEVLASYKILFETELNMPIVWECEWLATIPTQLLALQPDWRVRDVREKCQDSSIR